MRYGLIDTFDDLVLASSNLPLDLTETLLAMRSHSSAENSLVTDWIKAAGADFQEETGRQLLTARRYYWLDAFPVDRKIELPRPPLQVVEAVEYYNGDGDLVSFGDGASPETPSWIYKTFTGDHARRGYVELKYGFNWPTTQVRSSAVRITYQCGYGDTEADVPALIKSVLRQRVKDLDRLRGVVTEQEPYEIENVRKVINGFKYSAIPSLEPRRYCP